MRFSLCVAAILSGLAAPAWAQTAAPSTAPEVVVTATRAPAPLSQVGSSVSVVTVEALQKRQSVSVAEAISELAGVAFSRNGGLGGVTSVRIRGAEADQTVALIDGVKLNDPSSPGGGFNFANLLVGNIERIEVLRGPQSTLYGSQAIGGVVNVITKRGEGPPRATGEAEAGELETYRLRADISGGVGRLSYALAAGRFGSEGISALDARQGGRERDGFDNTAVSGRFGYALSPQVSADLGAWWAKSEAGIDGFPPPTFAFADTAETSEAEERVLHAGLKLSLMDGRFTTRLGFNRTDTNRENRDPAQSVPATFIAEGVNERIELVSQFDLTERVQLIGGWEREEARLFTRSPSSFNPNPRPTTGKARLDAAFAQVQVRPAEGLTATFGARKAEDDRFGDAVTLRATIAYSPNDGATILRASAGDGFKAPTPFQLFSDFGNARLQPEEAFAWDLGVEQALFDGRVRAGLTYFNRDAKNQIDFISCFGNASPICVSRLFGTYDNIVSAKADGWEAALQLAPTKNWRIDANYTALDARNRSPGALFDRRLPRRPRETANLNIGYQFAAGHDFGLGFSHVGASFDNAANTRRLKSYSLVSVRGSFAVRPRVSLYARLENAADEIYQTTSNYGSPPRVAMVGLRVRT